MCSGGRGVCSAPVVVGGYKRAELKDKLKERPQKGDCSDCGG